MAVMGSNPAQLKLEFALWNRRAVMMAVKTMFGIEMPIRTVGQYLLRWGFRPQRPVKRALEQDSGKLRQWLEIDYPAIALRAKTEGMRSTGPTRRRFARTRTGCAAMRRRA